MVLVSPFLPSFHLFRCRQFSSKRKALLGVKPEDGNCPGRTDGKAVMASVASSFFFLSNKGTPIFLRDDACRTITDACTAFRALLLVNLEIKHLYLHSIYGYGKL